MPTACSVNMFSSAGIHVATERCNASSLSNRMVVARSLPNYLRHTGQYSTAIVGPLGIPTLLYLASDVGTPTLGVGW